MSWEFALAIYGAVVSTILGIREILKERRNVKIILEYVSFYEYGQLIVVNTGHRPITIVKFGMTINEPVGDKKPNKVRFWDDVPTNALFGSEEPFPKVIDDGGQLAVRLSEVVSPMIYNKEIKIKVHLFDAEGNVYTKFQRRENNPRFGKLGKL